MRAIISPKFLLSLALSLAVVSGFSANPALAQSSAGSTQAPQKNWKDRNEYDLYEAITKETAPAKRLELLLQWKEKYPNSDFADTRDRLLMTTYGQLGRGADALNIAAEILAKDPNNLQALSTTLTTIFTIREPTPDQLAIGDKAANQVLSNLETLFSPDKRPGEVSETDWTTAKKNMQVYAQNTLAYDAWQRKDYDQAEQGFLKSLELEPNQGQVSYWLSNVILAERKPEKYSIALYFFARAASYDGPGSLDAQGRDRVRDSFEKTYTTYHGSPEGADQVLTLAKAAALPPPDFKIPSKADLAAAEMQKDEELKKKNPSLALWKSIKDALTGPQAQSYFNDHMKDTEIPMEFKGKLIAARPETNPKELVLAIEDGITADATLVLDAPLRGKMPNGSEIGFSKGVATKYTVSPYMLTFSAAKANITGWKGAPPPAKPKPHHRKKSAPEAQKPPK